VGPKGGQGRAGQRGLPGKEVSEVFMWRNRMPPVNGGATVALELLPTQSCLHKSVLFYLSATPGGAKG
jgi:hypothetical protein